MNVRLGRLCVLGFFCSGLAAAQEPPRAAPSAQSAYCKKVRARAEADAAMLQWPSLVTEVVRFPSLTGGALGPTLGNTGVQLRLGLAVSPMEMVRGARLADAAEADCALHEASEVLQQLFTASDDEATLSALRAKVTYLRANRETWEALEAKAEERLKAGVITIMELQGFRRSVIELQRKLTLAGAEVERLEQLQRQKPTGALSELAQRYAQASMGQERQAAGTRALEAFHVGLTGGMILGIDRSSEWYGQLVLSYQLGGLFGAPASRRALEARQEELDSAEYEYPTRVADARMNVSKHVARTWRELQIVDSELEANRVLAEALATAKTTMAEHARAQITLDQFSLEAERLYLTAMIEGLSRLSP